MKRFCLWLRGRKARAATFFAIIGFPIGYFGFDLGSRLHRGPAVAIAMSSVFAGALGFLVARVVYSDWTK